MAILREASLSDSEEAKMTRLVTSPQPAVAANRQELELLGQSDTVIHVGGFAKKHTVLIAKGLVQECSDFLQKHRCVVDLDKRVLSEEVVP